jgi:hypothetical protein
VLALLAFALLLPGAPAARAQVPLRDPPEAIRGSEAPRHGRLHRLLLYVPNRLLDLTDLFRARIRVGPGLAACARMTDQLWFFGGAYDSVYAGLPGPRRPASLRAPVGRETQKGLIVFGVDATDDSPAPPGYVASELDVGVHLLLFGVEVGFDPVEIGDLLAGFLLDDPRGDDL